MIILGILVCIAPIGFFCWLLFTLALLTLPFVAASTGMWTMNSVLDGLAPFQSERCPLVSPS
ncbi:hypothetical protein [Aminobacter sp. MET-1]|uniref:hypothetical protein n=1 Tax=Aminobacter sp. MET-1 TaxID=2951085 RepID=UPI002B409973|nr:hypothetical protein [Aminobacter sp. MET-1]